MKLTLFCKHSDFIKHLEAEVAWFQEQLVHERQRAEMAIDELLRVRVQAGPVTLAVEKKLSKEIEELLNNPEFARAGEVAG